ncbi:type II toxin-antitoxin system prevent-host-death family antitoxin [Veillonella magna]|uniref:type II toxin-antitoxin system prevent-host-death family antitoxin n=1 Tax=Veillonella magna TaxID=464322 RepID=UPI0023F0D8B8|nr:type II toxin-antitoxin system prevent-host-death family antitoxin [Veillonella magna]
MNKTSKVPMEYFNIGEFNKGQASKIIRGLSENDKSGFIMKNGKPIAVVLSYARYERLLEAGIDINEY